MRILHIINNIDRGGAETLLLNIIDKLQQRDSSYEISVLILEDKQYLRPQFDNAGINVECIDCLKKTLIKQVYKIWKYIKKRKPDVVHSHLLDADLVSQPAAWLANVKKRVCTIHNMEPNRGKRDRLTRFLTSLFATKLIAVSNSAKQFCVENNLYNSGKLVTIYNAAGFDDVVVTGKKKPKGPFRIINVGRLHPQKGQAFLLKAMSLLNQKNIACSLTIYGQGNEESNLNGIIQKYHLENVELYGITDDVAGELKKADLFVASSLWEGFHIALVEAIAYGVPVVATDIPPHCEILGNDYNFYVKPSDENALAEKINEIMKLDEDTYYSLSAELVSKAGRFSMANMINSYSEFYKEL